jgi:hypothetical protein
MKNLMIIIFLLSLIGCNSDANSDVNNNANKIPLKCVDTTHHAIKRCENDEVICYLYDYQYTEPVSMQCKFKN